MSRRSTVSRRVGWGGGDVVRLPPGDLARGGPGHPAGGGEHGHPHDPPQRQGARVPSRFHRRHGGGRLPALALDRGAGSRGGAPPLLRGCDACEGASDAHARDRSVTLGLPAATTWRVASSTSSAPGTERERLRPTSWSSYGLRREAAAPRLEIPQLATGDTVRHSTMGEGIVIRIEPDGVVTVRFATDGTERRLMLEYAPLERIG